MSPLRPEGGVSQWGFVAPCEAESRSGSIARGTSSIAQGVGCSHPALRRARPPPGVGVACRVLVEDPVKESAGI